MGAMETWLFDLNVDGTPGKTATLELGPHCRADLPPGTRVRLKEDLYWLCGVLPIATYSLRKAGAQAGPDIGVISAVWTEPAGKAESLHPNSD